MQPFSDRHRISLPHVNYGMLRYENPSRAHAKFRAGHRRREAYPSRTTHLKATRKQKGSSTPLSQFL